MLLDGPRDHAFLIFRPLASAELPLFDAPFDAATIALRRTTAMSSVDDAFLAAESLAPAEKLQLISRLWETMPFTGWRPSDSDLAEVKRRWAEIESGTVKAIPWEDVWSEIEDEMAQDDQS
jgi:putative addiction module component (TIGR02574 family)